jgi:serine phosphatase RsbU (regulator of sigma subunit)
MIVPMRSRDRVLGAISFAAAESAGAFYQADLEFARDIAARAAHAAENGRLYRERTETALTLQRSLRPYRLPDLPGWRIASVYRPGEHAVEIGGDFYDVFPAERGFTVIVGDVTGKGVPAATLTALTRHSARAAALQGLGPGAILRLLNRLLLEQPELSLVTAVVARVHQGARGASLTVASAGHPLPLRHRAGEDPVEVGRPGVLLGYVGQESWPEQTVPLQPRDTVLLYTDGVTDTVGADGRFGEARLRSALSASPSDPEVILGQIEAAVRAFERGEARDDVAMLAVQLEGAPISLAVAPA